MPSAPDTLAPARNLEIKVACGGDGLAGVVARLADLGTSVGERLAQVDTYFRVLHGRLKLRTIAHARGDESTGPLIRAELIGYERTDRDSSRWSSYRVVVISPEEADTLRTVLASTIGVLVTVTKRRDIAIAGQTRIHLDRVEGLGSFIELETVISTQSDVEAATEHRHVADALGLGRWPTVPGSYSDLLLAANA
ncbi:MAG: class IV adenylate cyclase [Thermomicrobiales bacterium]